MLFKDNNDNEYNDNDELRDKEMNSFRDYDKHNPGKPCHSL